MKKIKDSSKGLFVYFSGTGNTEFVARKYNDLFKNKGIEIELKRIEDLEKFPSLSSYDFVVIGSPVFGFSAPNYVKDFIKNIPYVEKKPAFIYSTCGGLNGATLGKLRGMLNKKNFDVKGAFKYSMPASSNGCFGKDSASENEIKGLLEKVENKIKNDFDSLINEEYKILKVNILFYGLSNITHFFFNRYWNSKFKWKYDETRCIQCGLCERICPTQNITLKKQKHKVVFSDKCIVCTRCFNFCPTGAIYLKNSKGKNLRKYTEFKKYFE